MLKNTAKRMIESSAFQRLTRGRYNNQTIILMYHGVCENATCHNDWLQVQEADFREQMKHLSENYDVISLMDAINGTPIEKKHVGPNIVITFDDGYENNYKFAYPILETLRLPATIFLVTDYVGTDKLFWYDKLYSTMYPHYPMERIERMIAMFKKFHPADIDMMVDEYIARLNRVVPDDARAWYSNLMCWQITEMARSGLITFGSHTQNHELLTNLTLDEVRATLSKSFLDLQTVPGSIPVICYPNGWYNGEIVNISSEIGYKAATRADHNGGGVWNMSPDLTFPLIPRWGIPRNLKIETFSTIVSGSLQALRTISRKD